MRSDEKYLQEGCAADSTNASQLQRLRSVLAGLSLAALGIVFMLGELNVFDLSNSLRDWWPVILIGFGLFGGGYVVVAFGTWLLIGNLELFGLGHSDSWPVILIVCGIAVTGRALLSRHHRDPQRSAS